MSSIDSIDNKSRKRLDPTFVTNIDIKETTSFEKYWFEPAYDRDDNLVKFYVAVHCKAEDRGLILARINEMVEEEIGIWSKKMRLNK